MTWQNTDHYTFTVETLSIIMYAIVPVIRLTLRRFPEKNLPVWLVFLSIFGVVAAGHSRAMPQPLRGWPPTHP